MSLTDAKARPTGKLYLMTLGILARTDALLIICSKLLLIRSRLAYRRQGLASKLLSHVLEKAAEASLAASLTPTPSTSSPFSSAAGSNKSEKKSGKNKGKAAAQASEPPKKEIEQPAHPPSPPSPILKSIFVHVQVGNEDAKSFWEGKEFVESEVVSDYYKKNIEGPRDAWVMVKSIGA